MNLRGHFWTVGSLLRRMAFPTEQPPSEGWSTTVEDPVSGTVRLTGRLSEPPGASGLVVLVHGLGGSSESTYLAQAARAALALGLASLRLNLRGADGEAGDFYHGGLTDDLGAAVRDLSPRFDQISILGYSLGGHIALRYGTEVDEPAVSAVAAICSPLDLAVGVDAIDRPSMVVYRRYVLRNLKSGFAPAALQRVSTSEEELRAVVGLREWDSLTVVPRFGFRDADDYYARASVGPLLKRLRCPALLVAAEGDPMIPPTAIRPQLTDSNPAANLTVRWLRRGGHVAVPRYVDLGLNGTPAQGTRTDYLSQILIWLQQTISVEDAGGSGTT